MKKYSLKEMANIKGGISRDEYCAIVKQIYSNNPEIAKIDSWSYVTTICGSRLL